MNSKSLKKKKYRIKKKSCLYVLLKKNEIEYSNQQMRAGQYVNQNFSNKYN